MEEQINRGDLFYAKLDGAIGSEQKGNRPVIVVQNDTGNKYSPTTIVVPLTKKINRKTKLPTHLNLKSSQYIKYDSTVLTEQVRVIDKSRLTRKVGSLDISIMQLIDKKLSIAIGILNFGE